MLSGKRIKTEKRVEVAGLGDEEARKVQDAFELFDYKKTGKVDLKDIKATLQSLGVDRGASLFNLITGLETKETPLDLPSFVDRVAISASDWESKAAIDRIFEHFDTEKLNLVSGEDLKKIARELNLGDEEWQVEALLRRLSTNGKISRDDFYDIVAKKSLLV